MTNARLAPLHGLPVVPVPHTTTPVPRHKPRARHERNSPHATHPPALPSGVWRRRSGCAASLISFRPLRLPLHAVKLPTEAFSQNMIRPTGAGRTKRWQIFDGMSKRRHIKSCALHSCLRNPLVLRHRLPLISTALFLQAVGSALVVVLNFSRSSRVCSRRSGGNFSHRVSV